MSTKCTISYSNEQNEDYHLYTEIFNDSSIYIETGSASEISIDVSQSHSPIVSIGIPIEVWTSMVEGWLKKTKKEGNLESHKES